MRTLSFCALLALAALGCSNSQAVVGGRLDAAADVGDDLAPDVSLDAPEAAADREVRCGDTQQNCAAPASPSPPTR